MSYDLRWILLYTRRAGGTVDTYAGTDARERYEQIEKTGELTLRHWEHDDPEKHWETFPVDMAILAANWKMVRPGVDRGQGNPIGTWRRP
jgi:hypothetical protein